MSKKGLVCLGLLVALMSGVAVYALQVGDTLQNLTIKNTAGADDKIPFLGKKVLLIQYNDVDVKDINDPISNAIKEKGYSLDKYQGIGIANCKDAPFKPDTFIKKAAAKKQAAFPSSKILLDLERTVPQAWGLGDCNDQGVIIIVGKDGKVKLVKKVKNQNESSAMISQVISVLDTEMSK